MMSEAKQFESVDQVTSPVNTELEFLLLDTKFADVTLHIKDKEFKAHKAIISARSPVFAAMFDSVCKESCENRVEILNIDVEVFQDLLRFIYTDRVHSLEQHPLRLYVAANQYQVEGLMNQCEQAILAAISVENVIDLLAFAELYKIVKLEKQCLGFFAHHHQQITDNWTTCPDVLLKTPELIVKLVKYLAPLKK